jgi:hypothetical protein
VRSAATKSFIAGYPKGVRGVAGVFHRIASAQRRKMSLATAYVLQMKNLTAKDAKGIQTPLEPPMNADRRR